VFGHGQHIIDADDRGLAFHQPVAWHGGSLLEKHYEKFQAFLLPQKEVRVKIRALQ
jgi:hypothetical protein